MGYIVDSAVIMAAGTASRFAPLSYEKPKALIKVKGEILIERQIRQLKEAGITQIIIVVGYQKDKFYYLQEKYGVQLVENDQYLVRNNHSTIYAVRQYLHNTYICSADNYFSKNPFEKEVEESYYAAVYADGETSEWCMEEDDEGYINSIQIGGCNAWYMLGHTFWSEDFSRKFVDILEQEYDLPETQGLLWESILKNHLHELKMKIKKYPENYIYEFDTLEELRTFDAAYLECSGSAIMEKIAMKMQCSEGKIVKMKTITGKDNSAEGFSFEVFGKRYRYLYQDGTVQELI